MNAKQLKSFIRSAELGSFSAAAKEAAVSSPSLISQVNTLEKEYGYPLFKRSTHSIELTPHGQVFYRAAREMLSVYEQFRTDCAKLADKKQINIASSVIQSEQLRDFCRCFQSQHPETEFHFRVMDEADASDALENDTIQLWFNAADKDDPSWYGLRVRQNADPIIEEFLKDYLKQ